MASRKAISVAGKPMLDPTLPKVPLTLKGKEYHLVFSFNAIATAESITGLNLFEKFDLQHLNAAQYRALLYSALLTENPDITLEDVGRLITYPDFAAITVALVHAWTGSRPEVHEAKEDKENPPEEQTDLS